MFLSADTNLILSVINIRVINTPTRVTDFENLTWRILLIKKRIMQDMLIGLAYRV
jgi:hypothetical protein